VKIFPRAAQPLPSQTISLCGGALTTVASREMMMPAGLSYCALRLSRALRETGKKDGDKRVELPVERPLLAQQLQSLALR